MSTSSTVTDAARRPRWQLRVRTLVLLMAGIGVWLADYVNRRDIRDLEARVHLLKSLVPELEVDDPKEIAFVKLAQHSMSDHQWDVYLPDAHYRLCLATRGLPSTSNLLPAEFQSSPLGAGRHRIKLVQRRTKDSRDIVAIRADVEALSIHETADWDAKSGSSSISDEPWPEREGVVLLRERFEMKHDDPPTPKSRTGDNGLMIWIERTTP
jgi:hypothetical protein